MLDDAFIRLAVVLVVFLLSGVFYFAVIGVFGLDLAIASLVFGMVVSVAVSVCARQQR